MQKPARPENPVALLPLTRPDGQQEKEASLKSKRLSAISAVALMSALSFASVVPASAQAIFSSPRAAASAGLNPNAANNPNAMNPNATGDPAPSGDASPYTAIFSQIQTATTGLLSGPGALAFGVLILGLGFGVAWRLVTKGVKSVAK